MNDSSHRAGHARRQCTLFVLSLALCAVGLDVAQAQEAVIPASYDASAGAPPQSYHGGGSFFSQSLNAHLRARYNTQSYGQGEGNFSLGTMRLFDLGNAASFIDGQVTMNDVDGVGYNVGAGYRWLWDNTLPIDPDPMRVVGVSIWSDGSSTINDHFFTELGLSFEALGELWDFRVNGYIPLGDRLKASNFTLTGDTIFMGSGLAQETSSPSDTALTVGEFEAARRVGNRDAWAFAGVYGHAGGEFDHSTGFKAGFRGYAFPDLLVQVAVTDDDLFSTNTVFSVVWFIGRTRNDECATCTVADRLREPVLRNDYVAVAQSTAFDGIPMTDTQGAEFNFVHVDSSAGAGGDGTFERPFNDISPVFLNSEDGNTILLHGGSQFQNTSIALRDNQQLLGEGDGATHQVTTTELGVINLPETATGASALARPRITQSVGGTSVTLARSNIVDNLNIVGGAVGINGTTATSDPTLRNLQISNTTADGIMLQPFARDDTADADNDTNTVEIDFIVNIDQITFNNVGGNDITINADPGVDPTLPNTDLNETINISNITSTNGAGDGVNLQNTHTGGIASITNSSFTGNSSGVDINNARGLVNVNNTTIANATGDAARVTNSTDVNFNTMDIDNAGGRGFNLMHTDAEAFSVQVDGSDVNGAGTQGIFADGQGTGVFDVRVATTMTTATLAEGFLADLDAAAGEADISVTGSTFTANGSSAFRLIGDQNTANDIDFLITGNTFTNTSNAAATTDLDVNDSATLNSTVQNNTLLNNGTASEFTIDTNNANASVRLFMTGNTADGGAGTFDLSNNAGTFTVQDLLNINANNTGTVNQNGVIGVDAGNIPTP